MINDFMRFFVRPALTRLRRRASISATRSSIDQSRSVTPAAIAGDMLSALCMRHEIVEHEVERQRVNVVVDLL